MRHGPPAVRRLWPDPGGDVDVEALEAALARPAPPGRPWVLTNMIASADGAAVVGGSSGALGGPADRRVFHALRAVADVILVGATTVRQERYRPPRVSDAVAEARLRRGQAARPRLAVVSASADLDPGLPLFDDPGNRPLLVTALGAPETARAALAERSELVLAGQDRVDLGQALGLLAATGARTVLAEGGPTLNGQLLAHALVDEWRLTLSPVLVGGPSPRVATGPDAVFRRFRLDQVLAAGELVFLRYVRP
jgi:riboflavin biosynthesis pyrimidine reductase